MNVRVAGAQIPVITDIATNLRTIRNAIEFAVSEKADILLTPEGSLSGYTPEFDADQTREALEVVTAEAKTHGLALALGTCFLEPDDQQRYNQVRFYDRDGRYLGFHSKILRTGSLEEPSTGEVVNFSESPLRLFEIGDISVGGLICNDMWANPKCTPMPDTHLTQQLSKLGARVVFHAVNGGSRDDSHASKTARRYHETNLMMRAMAGNLWVVTVDNCHPIDQLCSAPSGVVNPQGEWAIRARSMGEDLFAYTISL